MVWRYELPRLTPSREGRGGGVIPVIVLLGAGRGGGRSSSMRFAERFRCCCCKICISFSVELMEEGDIGPLWRVSVLVSTLENGIGEVVRVRLRAASGTTDACRGLPFYEKDQYSFARHEFPT